MTAEERQGLYQRALSELMRTRKGYVLFADGANGDNYAEVNSDMLAEVSHRRWPACKLPPLGPTAMVRLDRLGFRETERNPQQSFEGWTVPRIVKSLESVFLEVYGCGATFELTVTAGK